MNRLPIRIEIDPLDSPHGYVVTEYTPRGPMRYEVRGWGELIAHLIHRREDWSVGETIRIQIEAGGGDSVMWEGDPLR